MVTTEEILITMLARDEASSVFEQVAGNAQSQLNGISGSTDSTSSSFDNIGRSAVSNFDAIGSSISALNTGLMGLSSANRTMMGELGAKKSATELVFGTTSKEDTNKVLLNNMGDTEEQAQHMLETIDNVTDNSLTSMQDLIPALNAFKSATGASGQEIENVSGGVADFGAFVLAQTGSTQLASTAMMDLGKAIKGAYASLDQYGISEDALMRDGLWDGTEEDVEGFIQAVNNATGPVDELMNTAEGVDAQMGKMWSRAGKQIGREILPQTKSLKMSFMELDKELGGNLSKSVLLVSFGIEEAQQKFTMLNTTYQAFENMHKGFSTAIDMIRNMGETAEESARAVSDLAEATSNVSGVANTVGEASGGFLANGGEVVGEVSGLGAEYYQDMIAQNPGKQLQPSRAEFDAMMGSIYEPFDALKMQGETPSADEFLMTRGHLYEEMNKSWSYADIGKPSTNPFSQSKNVLNVHANELKEAEALFGDSTDDLISFSGIMGNYNDRMDEIKDQIRYVTESEDFGKSDANKSHLKGLTDQLSAIALEKEEVKNSVFKLKEEGHEGNFGEILSEVVGESFMGDVDTSKIDAEEESVRTLSQAIRGKFSGFRDSIGGALDSVKSIPGAIKGKMSSVKDSIKGVVDSFREIKADGLSGAINRLDTALYNPFRKTSAVTEAVAGAEEMAEGVGAVAESSAVVGAESATMGATAPAIEAGAVGAETTAVAETSLSGAFMSMLVPTLAIAGVIAILIPIVAGLVLEALFFVSLIGQVITAMNFDSINVDGVAEKLQALALAMAWIGVAMASMSFAGFMTGIAFVMTGFGQVQVVLGEAVTMINSAMAEVNKLGDNAVDESVVFNLQNLGNALNGISMAMMSLVGVNITSFIGNILTLGGTFGSLSSNLSKVKTDLQKAIDTINSMDFTGIDADKVSQISTVMEAIGNFGSAFDGLLKIRDGAKWSDITNMLLDGIFGTSTESVQQAFANAHNDLLMASRQLGQYNDLDTVDEETANKIKNVSDSIVAVADALESLKKLKEDKGFMGTIDSFLNGGNDNLLAGLDTANQIVREASTKLASLKSITEIDESVGEKLQKVNDTLKVVNDAITALGQIKTADKDMDFSTIPKMISEASSGIRSVATELSGLKDMTEIDESVSAKLTKVSNTLGEVNDALTGISTVNQTTGGWDFKGLNSKFKNIGSTLGKFASEMSSLGKTLSDESHTIPEDLSSKLSSVASATSSLNQTVGPMNSMPQIDGKNIGFKVARAVTGVKNASFQLRTINNSISVGADVPSTITSVGNAFNSLKTVALTMNEFPQVNGQNIGFKVARAVTGVKRASSEMKKLTNTDKVNNLEGILSNVRSSVDSLKATLDKMNFNAQGKNIGTGIRNGLGTGIGNLAGIFQTKIRAGVNGSSAYASGKTMGTYVTNGVKATAKFSQIFKDEMGYIKQSLDSHGDLVASAKAMAQAVVEGAREGAESHSPGAIARMWGEEMVYSSMLMEQGSGGLIRSARNVANNVVSTFNNRSTLTPKLMNFDTISSDLNKTQFSTMMELRKPSNMGTPQRPVQIHIGEGAVQLDARNMTQKESRQIMINALEGLDMVTGIEVDKNI